MIRKKFMAVAMSAVLAVSLCPGLAMADSLTGGAADLSAKAPAKTSVSTKAKKTVYVLTDYDLVADSWTYYDHYDGTPSSGDETYTVSTDATTKTDKWTYNTKTGLLTSDGNWDLKYSGVNLKSATEHVDAESVAAGYVDTDVEKYAFKSKKGLVKSETYTEKYTDPSVKYQDRKRTVKYTYDKKGCLTKAATTNYGWSYGDKYWTKLKKTGTSTDTLTINKKGLPSKSVTTTKNINKSTSTSATVKYSYDKKKNLTKATTPYSDTTTYKYSGYKNGVPTKLIVTTKYTHRTYDDNKKTVTDTETYTYALTYTKLKVSKANAAVAKRQQWALLNGTDLNGAFGDLSVRSIY